MARLEKRRMTESANNSSSSSTTILKVPPPSSSTLLVNGLPTSHANTNEIENLLFKQEHDTNTLANQQYSVTIPENILLNQQMTNSIVHYQSSTTKRQRGLEDHLENTVNGPLSPNKKTRIGIVDGTKLTNSSPNKSTKKNRNKQQQQQPQQQIIIKTSASGIFPQQQPQQTINLQNIDESSDVSQRIFFL
jgi:hypothetical protein